MKDKKVLNFQIVSIIFDFILGILLHFTYKWSGDNQIVAAFSAINESTWEHLKLIFFPMLITTIIGYFYIGKEIPQIICAKAIGIAKALLFIVTFFYTYTGIIGTNFAIIDISSFFIAVLLGEYTAYKIMVTNKKSRFNYNKKIAITFLILLLLCFVIFTYYQPQIALFNSPV